MSEGTDSGLKILITNNTLAARAGSELYVRDLSIALMKQGHHPIVYSTVLGDVADELYHATIPVIDDLHAMGTPPDIIHGQHHLETMTAALHFSNTPVVYMCHGWLPWEELPPVFPTILRYVAVDDLCRERLLTTPGVAEKNVEVLYNFVDLQRFHLRPPLPEKPQSAIIFSNYAEGRMVETVRAACQKFGINQIDVAGIGVGNLLVSPETTLGQYDLVFAKARCALEAMASGCAVIVADFAGLGGLVTMKNFERMRRLNFGVRTMQASSITEEAVLSELQRYNAGDARLVSCTVRAQASLSQVVDRWQQIYEELLQDWQLSEWRKLPAFSEDQLRSAAGYLRSLAPTIKARYEMEIRAMEAQARASDMELRTIGALAHASEAEAQLTESMLQVGAAEAYAISQTQVVQQLELELEKIYGSRSWKFLTQYRRVRAWLRRFFLANS